MPVIRLKLEGDNAWPDLKDRLADVLHLTDTPIQMAALEHGMASGRPSLALRVDLPDGRVLVFETSVAAFLAAAAALRGRFGDL